MILAIFAAFAEDPVDDGRRLLHEGRADAAATVFRAILAEDANHRAAWEGLAQSLLVLGEAEEAAKAADARLALDPGDAKLREHRLYVLGMAGSRRDEAIAGYLEIVAARPKDLELRLLLAQFLSWSEGRAAEAAEHYRVAVTLGPRDRRALLGLARTLAWSGQNREAIERFDALLAASPDDLDALLGRAQLARWTGDRVRARTLLDRAGAVGPADPRIAAERAFLDLDSGRATRAAASAEAAIAAAPGLYEAKEALRAVEAATSTSLGIRTTYSVESTPFRRLTVALPVELFPFPDTRVRLEPAFTRFGGDGEIDRVSLGGEVRQAGMPAGLYVGAAWRAHVAIGIGTTHELGAEVGAANPGGLPVATRVGVRQRSLVDSSAGYEDVALLTGVGSGGGTIGSLREELEIREAHAALSASPWGGMYVYGDGAMGRIDDGNRRTALAAGLGQDLLAASPGPWSLTLKYDLYALALAEESELYFSPAGFVVHTPGLDVRWTRERVVVGVEAGVPIEERVGWLAGGFVGVEADDRVTVEARVRTFDDTEYTVTAATVGVGGVF